MLIMKNKILFFLMLTSPNYHTKVLRYFNDDDNYDSMPLVCCILKHFFYIPPVLVVWGGGTTSRPKYSPLVIIDTLEHTLWAHSI
jgi:hypothetical protein